MKAGVKTFILSLALLAPAVSALAEPAHAAAAEFVQRRHMGANLKTLALKVAQRTQTFLMLKAKVGAADAAHRVADALDRQAPRFAPRWDASLATIYARNFTAEELRSLTAQGADSRYAAKLADKQGAIGADMQRVGTPLLTQYVSAALSDASSDALSDTSAAASRK